MGCTSIQREKKEMAVCQGNKFGIIFLCSVGSWGSVLGFKSLPTLCLWIQIPAHSMSRRSRIPTMHPKSFKVTPYGIQGWGELKKYGRPLWPLVNKNINQDKIDPQSGQTL